MRLFKKICLFGALIPLFFSCRKPTVANWDVDVALPLVNSQLNIKNFIGDSIFKADNTGLLNLVVNREITAIKLDSLIAIPDTAFVRSFTVFVGLQPVKVAPGKSFNQFPSTEIDFNINNGVALKRVDMRSGLLSIAFSNTLTQPLDMTYMIPNATRNGQPFTIFETIPPGKNSLLKEYDLTGFSFNMTGLTGNSYNSISQTYTMAINPNADTALVGNGEIARIEVGYKKLVPQYIEGYFGQQVIKVPLDTAKLDLVKNFYASNFLLNDANLKFRILNEFGAEFSAALSNIKSINSLNNTSVALTTGQLSYININRATQAAGTIFPSIKEIELNKLNSNILPFLSNLPDKLTSQGIVKVNPLGNISGYHDFAFYDKGIHVIADINIPMRFNADYFRLKSNTVIDFKDVEQLDNVKSGNFVINATNGYPFKARLQAYLLDEAGKTIDSLFVPGKNTIEGGQLDNNNKVVAPFFSKVLVPVDAAKIANLRRSKSIQIITYFLMPPNPPDITIYEDYQFKVNIVAELTYNVERK